MKTGQCLRVTEGIRTPDPWNHNPSMEVESDNEKPKLAIGEESCLSSGLSEFCSDEIQAWIEACPIELAEVDQGALVKWLKLLL